MQTLYERAKAAELDIDNHESDLYLKDTPEAQTIIKDWQKASGLDGCITYFKDEGVQWIDIPFMFDPFWPDGSSAKFRYSSNVHEGQA